MKIYHYFLQGLLIELTEVNKSPTSEIDKRQS